MVHFRTRSESKSRTGTDDPKTCVDEQVGRFTGVSRSSREEAITRDRSRTITNFPEQPAAAAAGKNEKSTRNGL